MPIDVHAALREAKNRLATDASWIFLLEVALPGTTLRLARSLERVRFDGEVYEPFPFQIGDITADNDGNLVKVDLAAFDMSGVIRQAMRDFDFDGAPVLLRLVESGDLATPARVIDSDFVVRGYRGTFDQVVFELGHPDFMLQQFPARSFIRTRCSWVYMGAECGYAGALPTCDRTLEGANGCRVHANQTRFGGAPAIPRGRNV